MKTQTKDLMYFEEKHTAWLRNANVFELALPNAKSVYAVLDYDDEYGRYTHRNISFTVNEAFRSAVERVEMWRKYGNYILVHEDEKQDFMSFMWGENAPDDFMFDTTDMCLSWWTPEGEAEKVFLFGYTNLGIATEIKGEN
jgi:hypothetical protein